MKNQSWIAPIFLLVVAAFIIYQIPSKSPKPESELLYEKALENVKDTVSSTLPVDSRTAQEQLKEIEERQFMRKYSQEVINTVNSQFKEMLNSGGIKPDFENKKCQINPDLWNLFDMNGKKSVLQIIQLKYAFENLKNADSFTYYDLKTGRKIASYSEWSDFSFY